MKCIGVQALLAECPLNQMKYSCMLEPTNRSQINKDIYGI